MDGGEIMPRYSQFEAQTIIIPVVFVRPVQMLR